MYDVSQSYKDSMKSELRNHSYMRVSLGLINQEAQSSAVVENQSQYTAYSDLETIFDKNDIGLVYATLEQDFFKMDGSMTFMPRDASEYQKNGLITSELFQENMLIKFSFGYGISDIRGLSIQFGDNYPTLFSVITSDGTEVEFENDTGFFETDTVFENTDSITLKIKSVHISNQRVRIYYIKFGLGLQYDNDWIMSTESSSTLSAINEDLPEINFSVNLRNDDQRFNVDNPSSEINFLETGQKVSVQYGYELDDGTVEWMQLHTLFVSEWSADDSQAKISAVDRFKYMSETYYKGQYYDEGISLYDLAVDVMTDAGLEVGEYYIESFLKNIVVNNPVPNVTHKEALQIIANAGRCILSIDRYGRIRIHNDFIPEHTTTSNGTTYYSDVSNIDDNKAKKAFATLENNFFKMNGTMFFVPRTGIADTGYVSAQISGEDCTFSQNPIITRELEAKYQCYGIKIQFNGAVPAEFVIRTYSDDALVDTFTVNSGISEMYETDHHFEDFDKMEIEFIKTQIPYNRIHIDYIQFGDETDYSIEYDDLYSTPTGAQLELVKNVKNARIIYSKSSTQEEIASDKIAYDGSTVFYYFSDAYYGYEASIEDPVGNQSVSVKSSGAYFVELEFSNVQQNIEIEFSVTGYKYNISTSYYTVAVNNRGTDQEWSNPLISDYDHCKDVAEWLADYYAAGVEYELDYRGEPAIDCGDVIFQENKYNSELKTIVEEFQLSFSGGISGALRTRRRERVDRAENGLATGRQI